MYVTGSVNNLADLLTAIRAACTANGWTLSGAVLHKGNVYVRTEVVSGDVQFLAGTGIDGSNNLAGAAPNIVRMKPFTQAFTFPMTYEVHINTAPDEVYVFINYSVDFFQWAAWGQSTVQGLPGTGIWVASMCGANTHPSISISAGGGGNANQAFPTPFGLTGNAGGQPGQTNSYVQHGLDAETWNPQGTDFLQLPSGPLNGYAAIIPLLQVQPNAWNQETVLIPVQAWRQRAANKVSLVADLAYARHCRIDNHQPGDIITLGSDEWKLYPCYRKDVTARDGGNTIQHTGTFGLAIRYTGP